MNNRGRQNSRDNEREWEWEIVRERKKRWDAGCYENWETENLEVGMCTVDLRIASHLFVPAASKGAQRSKPLPSLPALAVRPSLCTYWSLVVIPIYERARERECVSKGGSDRETERVWAAKIESKVILLSPYSSHAKGQIFIFHTISQSFSLNNPGAIKKAP